MAERLTKEEIARQFELPERKSKLASLFKKDTLINCICESQDSSLYIVACDSCGRHYHGSCLGMSEREYKNVERYYCIICQKNDPSLVSVFKVCNKISGPKCKRQLVKKGVHIPEDTLLKKEEKKERIPWKACGVCKNCNRISNCGICCVCRFTKNSKSKRRGRCIERICVKLLNPMSNEIEKSSQSEEEETSRCPMNMRSQCYGPGCTESSKPNSKYCSDKCGMKLATNRILQILPQRLQEWSMSTSHAELLDKKALEDVRMRQTKAQEALQQLDKKCRELEDVIAKGKLLEPSFKIDADLEKRYSKKINLLFQDEKEESSIYCVTCGQEIHTSSAIKHMEKCFIKYESQSSFGSIYKTKVQGNNIFCDFYNPPTKTYCKRLRVLCPEHTKEAPMSSDQACGCPLTKALFEEGPDLCLVPKKYCLKHYSWEKVRRAEIDLERVRFWLLMDELVQAEANIRRRITQRAGVLPLLLHSTYDHDALEEMTSSQEAERMEQLEKTLRQNYDKGQFEKISKEHKKFIKSLEKSVSS